LPWFKEGYQRYVPSLTWQVRPQLPRVLEELAPDSRAVDLGAGGRRLDPRVLRVDFIPFPGTQIVADVSRLPFRDGSLDLVIGTGLLEHVEDERAVLAESARCVRPGGLVHMELPFLQQYHDDPIDCRRLTVDGLVREMRRAGLEPVQRGVHIGPTVMWTTLTAYYLALLFEGRSLVARAVSTGVFILASILLWPAKFLDRFLVDKRSAHRLAFGIYCSARKPLAEPAEPAESAGRFE
jgi:SAM-dependent methyltransferase